MGLFRKKPYIPGLAHLEGFEERASGPGVGYLSVTTAVVAVAIGKREFDAYVAGFRQIPGMNLDPLKLEGGVEGWRCTQGVGTAYLLTAGSSYAILNVDSRPGQQADLAAVEGVLHTLEFR
jgi:hypothetical protein